MPEIVRSALLPYPAEFMYRLVNDAAAYPEFLPWCSGVEIHHQDDTSMEASILMKAPGISSRFRTRDRMVPGESIDIDLVDGPFEQLQGRWSFRSLNGDDCKIELVLKFEVRRGLGAKLIGPAFNRIANTMVDSFCRRARETYER